MSINNEEPNTAPQPDRWYTLSLGSSFRDDQPSPKYCTLRYEFKPASIDKKQPGVLHKTKENRVTVEFQNNQPEKPKVTFEGSSEDYKENDAVLFFDGQNFRLERLHKAVKQLRHVRQLGESSLAPAPAAAAAAVAGNAAVGVGTGAGAGLGTGTVAIADTSSPSPLPGALGKGGRAQNLNLNRSHNPVPVEVERIDIGDGGNSGAKSKNEQAVDAPPPPRPYSFTASPDSRNDDFDQQLDIMDEYDNNSGTANKDNTEKLNAIGIDINNLPHQMEADDEIADVDVNDDDADAGRNAAEALRAQVNAQEREQPTSSSSSSSASESGGSSSRSGSGSGSASSSSDSDSGDDVSLNSI